jgi:hypothetical protein
LGQIIQATGHVVIYWLKLPWSLALLALAAIERLPGLKWLKAKRYFRLLDVPNDRADLEKFKQSELFKRARLILAERSGLAAEQIVFENARDLALAVLGPDAAERHKFLNLSELCIGMAGAHFLCGAVVILESVCHQHAHGPLAAILIGIGGIFILRQPRYFEISEKVVFGQLLINHGATLKVGAGTLPEAQ